MYNPVACQDDGPAEGEDHFGEAVGGLIVSNVSHCLGDIQVRDRCPLIVIVIEE